MGTSPETVVLVHGLYMRGLIMDVLARRLERQGYETFTFSYHSVRSTLRENALALGCFLAGLHRTRVHLVAHSLGGLVLRHLAAIPPGLPQGRVVTLGTPHTGSRVAWRLRRRHLGALCGRGLSDGLLGDLPPWPADHPLGSLAGSVNMGLGRLVTGVAPPADGMVAVAETRLAGMSDHIVLPVSHTVMLFVPSVAAQVARFLDSGHFDHGAGGVGGRGAR